MAWVRVVDSLPEVGEWVLIYTPVKKDHLIEIAMLDILHGFINPAMGYGEFKNVTHWMSCPEPPNEADDLVQRMNAEMLEKLAKILPKAVEV